MESKTEVFCQATTGRRNRGEPKHRVLKQEKIPKNFIILISHNIHS